MSKTYKIIVPKPASNDELGLTTKLYEAGTIVTADAPWKEELMAVFEGNGWAMECKVQDTTGMERARNDKGHYVADDPSTPEVPAFVSKEEDAAAKKKGKKGKQPPQLAAYQAKKKGKKEKQEESFRDSVRKLMEEIIGLQ